MNDPLLRVEVDGLPVDVDPDAWGADQEAVEAEVRELRAAMRLEPLADEDRDPDYARLYGEDG